MLRIVGPLLLLLACFGQALGAEAAKTPDAPAKDSAAAAPVVNSKSKKKSPESLDLNQIDLEQVEEDWKSTPQKSEIDTNSSVRIKEIIEPSSEYSYASFGSGDPFLQPDLGLDSGLNMGKAPLQPVSPSGQQIQMVSLLQGYPLSDLTVKGLWQVASGETRAIILTPRNEGVVVKEGDPISSGKVISIRRDQLLVRLYRLRSDGVREFEDVPLKVSTNANKEKGVIKLDPGKDPIFDNPEKEKIKALPPAPALTGPVAPAAAIPGGPVGVMPNLAIPGVLPTAAPALDKSGTQTVKDGALPPPQ